MPVPLELEAQETAPAGWDAELRALGGVVFHSEGWASYKVAESGGEPLFCSWRDGERVVGRALAIRRPPRDSRTGRLAAKVTFDAPPAAAAVDFVPAVRAWARGVSGLIEVKLGSYDVVGSWTPGELPRPKGRCEFVLPPGDADDVLGQMRQLARRKVKRARKAGVAVRPIGAEDLRAYAEAQAGTEARLQRSKDLESEAKLDVDVFARALAELLGQGIGRLYGAYREGALEAGTVFATFGERAYMVHSAATDEGRDLGAPFLVMSEGLRDLREQGFATINLGGAAGDAEDPDSADHGLFQFKTRFGASPEPRTSGTLVLRPLRAGLVAGARKVVRR